VSKRFWNGAAGVVFWTSVAVAAIAVVLLCSAILEDAVETIKEISK
jgi:hypothetical protein